jgi:hypothetical protein
MTKPTPTATPIGYVDADGMFWTWLASNHKDDTMSVTWVYTVPEAKKAIAHMKKVLAERAVVPNVAATPDPELLTDKDWEDADKKFAVA